MAAPYVQVTAIGVYTGSDEVFSYGFKLIGLTSLGVTQDDWDLKVKPSYNAISTAIASAHAAANLAVPARFVLQNVKLAYCFGDGTYIEEPVENPVELNVAGGNNSQAFAPQLATVVTLAADKWRDPGKYNRFYVPTIAYTNGQMTTAQAKAKGVVIVAMITAINTALATGGAGVIVGVHSKAISTASRAITVRVGNILDTQRRRRNKLVEIYENTPIS